METAIEFVKNNWNVLAPVAALAISEIWAINPKCKANGILHGILSLLKKDAK